MFAQDDSWVLKSGGESGSSPTEAVNPRSIGIDGKTSLEIVRTIHEDDLQAWEAARDAAPETARVVEEVVQALKNGGRLIYLGAGTSGRLGVLDASECPPTFGVEPELVVGVIAGGDRALRESVEGAEDSPEDGRKAVEALHVNAADVVCGIAASGRTPYVWGALEEASRRQAVTVLITCNPEWRGLPRADLIQHAVVISVGPEIIAGSTRMKAGTATKLVLNAITTAVMIRRGKVHDNLMVDLKPLNRKLQARQGRLVQHLLGVDSRRASELLRASQGNVKSAILMARRGVDRETAGRMLERHEGVLRRALEDDSRA